MTIYAALMAALMAVGAFLAVPIGPVPIVLQNLFVFLAGLLLGPKWGTAGVAIYLFAGTLGLPVFAGGTGGIARFAGHTGGYLLGFLPAVLAIGLISKKGKETIVFDVLAMVAQLGRPYCAIHARDDDTVAFANAEQLHQAAQEPKELVPLETGGHLFASRSAADQVIAAVIDWFDTTL